LDALQIVVIADALVACLRKPASCMSALLFCCTVVWITELVRVKKSWKLVEISVTTFFSLVELIFKKIVN